MEIRGATTRGGKWVADRTFEGLVEVDGVLARVGGRRRQGEAGHRRRSVRRACALAHPRGFDSIWSAPGGRLANLGMGTIWCRALR